MNNYQEIVTINEDGLRLYSGLSSRQFAIAKMSQYITEPGLIFVPKDDGSYDLQEYRFNTTKSTIFKGAEIVAVGVEPFKGQTLYSYLNGNATKAEKIAIIEKLNNIVEWSFIEGIVIPNCGPLGTIINDDNNIVFLPFDFYQRSMYAQTQEEASEFFGCWTNGAIDEVDGWRFTLSAYVYTIITGKKPYAELVSAARAMDYYDNKYLPLQYSITVNNTNESFIAIVDNNLSLTNHAYQVIKPLKNSSAARRIKLKAIETQKKTSNASKALPASFGLDFSQITELEKDAKIEKKLKKQADIIRRKRFIRKNATKISVISAIIVAVGIIVGSLVNNHLNQPTTEGMNPYEVVETFYESVNTVDSTTLLSCGNHGATKHYSNMFATILVSAGMKEVYESSVELAPPENWVNFDNPLIVPVFGLTNVAITEHSMWNAIPAEGETIDFTVTGYMIYRPEISYCEISSVTDTLTLTYGKDFWQITSFDTERVMLDVDMAQFEKDLETTRAAIKADSTISVDMQGVELSKLLQPKYVWLPSEKDILEAVTEMPKEYFLPLPTEQ